MGNQFSVELFLSTLFRWLSSLPGLLLNAALLYTIICDKNLRGTCPTLLAIGSFADLLFLLSLSVPFFITLSGQNVVSNFCCYFFLFLPEFGVFSSVWVVFFVGFDRLIAILFPLRYNVLEKSLFLYLLPMLTVTFGYSIYVLVLAAKWSLFTAPDRLVPCIGIDLFGEDLSHVLLINGLVINSIALLCYALVGLALLRSMKKTPNSAAKHRIFKSLSAIMLLVVGSYFADCAFLLITSSLTDPFFITHISPSVQCLLTCTAQSSNAPILYAFSSEYRLSFRKCLKKVPLIGKCFAGMDEANGAATNHNQNGANAQNATRLFVQSAIPKSVAPKQKRGADERPI